MQDFTSDELQRLVFMTGSKGGLGTYLGLDARQLNELWEKHGLKKPVAYLRDLPELERLRLLGRAGSLKELAKKLGCSESGLRPLFMGPQPAELDWDLERTLEQFERHGSVRAVAFQNETTESAVRKLAEKHDLDLADLTNYACTNHSNGKGRRAELEFARLRGDRITADRNHADGPSAPYDFDDEGLGRVNVKSSRQHKYRSQARSASPHFWKFSTRGWQQADVLVCLAYDRKMEDLVGVFITKASATTCHRTIIVTRDQLEGTNGLRYGHELRASGAAPSEGPPPATDRDGHGGDEPQHQEG